MLEKSQVVLGSDGSAELIFGPRNLRLFIMFRVREAPPAVVPRQPPCTRMTSSMVDRLQPSDQNDLRFGDKIRHEGSSIIATSMRCWGQSCSVNSSLLMISPRLFECPSFVKVIRRCSERTIQSKRTKAVYLVYTRHARGAL